MRLILVRHGETDKNRTPSTKGHNVPLNKNGRLQAESVARWLADQKIEVIYSSDLRRAEQTTEAITTLKPRAKVVYTKELRERNSGEFSGRSVAEREAAAQLSGQSWRDWRPANGESLRDVKARATSWFAAVCRQHMNDTVLVVSHGYFLYTLLEVAVEGGADVEREDFSMSNGGLTVLDVQPEGRVKIVHLNGTSHLSGTETLPSGIKADIQSKK